MNRATNICILLTLTVAGNHQVAGTGMLPQPQLDLNTVLGLTLKEYCACQYLGHKVRGAITKKKRENLGKIPN